MFITSVLLQAVGLFLLTVAYGKYANDGVGSFVSGRMFEATSEIFYILMLILLGKGYTVTRARLRSRSVVKVTVFMSLYCVTYIALFTHLFITLLLLRGRRLVTTVFRSGESSLCLRISSWLRIAGFAISGLDDFCLWIGFHAEALPRKKWVLSTIFLLFIAVVHIEPHLSPGIHEYIIIFFTARFSGSSQDRVYV